MSRMSVEAGKWWGWLLFWLAAPVFAQEAKEEADVFLDSRVQEHPPWFKESFLDIREDIAEAEAAGKRLLLYFYQDGCPYCKKLLETNLAQRDIVEAMRKGFDVIAINIWGDREVTDLDGGMLSEKRFAEKRRVQYTPTLLFLDEQGQVVLRLNGYYPPDKFKVALDYVSGRHEKRQSIREFFAERQPPASSGRLHREEGYLQPPYRLDTLRSGKPLLVLFEQKDCPPCDELHQDIFKRQESRELLKQFDIVLLDMWGKEPVVTPEGKSTTARDWAKALGIQYAPTMVFYRDGKEVFRAEAYLKAFHIQSALDYVASKAYLEQPNFQRFLQVRADALEAKGIHIDLMK